MTDYQNLLYEIYFVVGAIFLGLTFAVYVSVSKLRKSLFNKILCAHVASLFVCYVSMALAKIAEPPKRMWCCKLMGYVIQCSFIASALWLNVMCLSIFNSFRSLSCCSQATKQLQHTNTFVIYSAFVWGGTTLMFIVTFFAENTAVLNPPLKPQLGINSCWFQNRISELLYFYSPVTVVLAFNLFLFICTIKKILFLHQKASNVFSQESKKHVGNSEVSHKQFSFTLYSRLFSLMGITWIFEVLSWAIDGPDYYWYVPDAVNALRGVFVFVICCCKKEVFFLISKRSFGRFASRTSTLDTHPRSSASQTESCSVQMVPLNRPANVVTEESA